MQHVYLDHSATTPLAPEVYEAMRPHFLENFGNASSVHSFGRRAKLALEESREEIAKFIGARYDEVYFTSGGTEADNHAVAGIYAAVSDTDRKHVITSAVEHHAVLHAAEALRTRGASLTVLPVDRFGRVSVSDVRKSLTAKTALVSIMHANNEVGTIQPIEEIGRCAHDKGVAVHSDTVQTLGKVPIDARMMNVDLMAFSAHKIYGPKGIGAIYIRKGTKLEAFLKGGAQESNRRAGTENVPLAVGFAKAVSLCRERMEQDNAKFRTLGEFLRGKISADFEGAIFNGDPANCLPNIVSVSFDSKLSNVDGEALIMGMDLQGVAVTSGSACSSGSMEPSHVLLAMGRDPKTARATIRFSLGRSTTEQDLEFAVAALKQVVANMQPVSAH